MDDGKDWVKYLSQTFTSDWCLKSYKSWNFMWVHSELVQHTRQVWFIITFSPEG